MAARYVPVLSDAIDVQESEGAVVFVQIEPPIVMIKMIIIIIKGTILFLLKI